MARIKSAIGRGRCRCLKQDGQDVLDGQDDSTLSRGWCKCLKQDGQDKEGVLLVTCPLACCWRCVSEAGWPGLAGWPGEERPRCGWCKCLKQDGQDVLDGQDKEGGSVFAQCLTSC